jgi:GR25 family glycosyltransferase involved in LPS biosynthesis
MNIKPKIKIYIINLEKHQDRRDHIINEVNKISNIQYDFFKGIDGREDIKQIKTNNDKIDILIYKNSIFLSNYNERIDYNNRGKLSLGQIGCDLSHLFICDELIFDDEYEYYLVLEDDSSLNVDENTLYEYINNLPENFDFIHLDKSEYNEFEKTNKENEYYYNIKKKFFNRTSSYIISKSGAAKYVSFVKNNICRPPDDSFSNLFIFKNFKVLVPNEWLFILSEHSKNSTIGYNN